ncbi:MAG: tripartite tricarboxylate transporter substrate-binding protein [Rhodospirillales bacterium]
MRNASKIALALALACQAAPAEAQEPKRPFAGQAIVLVEPSGAGTVTHYVAELLKPGLERALGAVVAVETVPSPDGAKAFERVYKARADGRALLVMTDASRLFHEYLAAPRDRIEFMTPIAKLTDGVSLTLAVRADSAVQDYAGLAAALKANRAPSLALNGNTTPSGVFAAMVEDHAGGRFGERRFDIDFRIDDALRAGQTEFGILPSAALFRPSGKPNELRALATSGARRHPKLPDAPTLSEITGNKKLSFTAAAGLYAPPNLSIELAEALTRAVLAAQTAGAKEAAEKASIPLNVQNSIVLRESMARAKRVIADLLNP